MYQVGIGCSADSTMATPNYNHPLGSQGSDLQFSTSVNTNINQHVPVPPVPTSASVPQQQ